MQVGGAAARKIALLEHPHKGHHTDDHGTKQPGGLAGIRAAQMADENNCHNKQAERIIDEVAQGIHVGHNPPMHRLPFYYNTSFTERISFFILFYPITQFIFASDNGSHERQWRQLKNSKGADVGIGPFQLL